MVGFRVQILLESRSRRIFRIAHIEILELMPIGTFVVFALDRLSWQKPRITDNSLINLSQDSKELNRIFLGYDEGWEKPMDSLYFFSIPIFTKLFFFKTASWTWGTW
jgi:hypothetical protein